MLFNSIVDVMSGDKIFVSCPSRRFSGIFFFLPRFIAVSSWISPKRKLLSCDETCDPLFVVRRDDPCRNPP